MRKKLITLIIILLACFTAQANMTKVYIGMENNQVILGVETRVVEAEKGMFSLDLRNYFPKTTTKYNGLNIVEQPGQFKTSFTLAGIEEAVIYAYEMNIHSIAGQVNSKTITNTLSTKSGSGTYLFYE